MFEEEKKLIESFAALLDVIGGFGRDAQSSNMNWGVNDIAGRTFPTPKSLNKSPESAEYVEYVVYVSRPAWLFRLLRCAEKEIEDSAAGRKTQGDRNLSFTLAGGGRKSYESARQILQAVRNSGIEIPDAKASDGLIGCCVLRSISEQCEFKTQNAGKFKTLTHFKKFVEDVAFWLSVPDKILNRNLALDDSSKLKDPELNAGAKYLRVVTTPPDENSINEEEPHLRNQRFVDDKGGIKDRRVPLPLPDLSNGQNLIVLASSWHGIALVPVGLEDWIQAAEYLMNDKFADRDEKERGAECAAAFTWDEFQRWPSEFRVEGLVKQSVASTTSDDSATRKIFIVAESTRAMIEIGVASRFFSHIVRPVGSRFDDNKKSSRMQTDGRAMAALRGGFGAMRVPRWLSISLGLLVLLWLVIGSAVIIDGSASVSPDQSSVLPLSALGVALVMTAAISGLSYRLLVGVSFGSKRAFQGRMTRKTLKDQVATELDHSTMLRRLRAQLSARSVQFWTDLHQDHKVWSFAEDVVENRLGVRKAEQQVIHALDNRIAASSDFKLDVVSYQRRQSRWLRIVFAGALSAFVALEFMELITEWFGLHYGQSVYDLIGCVAQFDGAHAAGCGSSSLENSLAESKKFRVASILAVFAAIGAVVVGTVVALGRKLDDDE